MLPTTTVTTPRVPSPGNPAPSRWTERKAPTRDRPSTVYSKRCRSTTGDQASVAIDPTAASSSATTFSRTVPRRWTAGTVAIIANTAVSTAVTTAAPLRSASLSTPTTTPPSTSVSSENTTGRPPVRAANPQVYAVLVAIAPASASQSPTYPARAATGAPA